MTITLKSLIRSIAYLHFINISFWNFVLFLCSKYIPLSPHFAWLSVFVPVYKMKLLSLPVLKEQSLEDWGCVLVCLCSALVMVTCQDLSLWLFQSLGAQKCQEFKGILCMGWAHLLDLVAQGLQQNSSGPGWAHPLGLVRQGLLWMETTLGQACPPGLVGKTISFEESHVFLASHFMGNF